jgi:hypothetical protein
LEQNVRFYPLKTLVGRQYSLQKLTQFSLANNMLDGLACNLEGFLSRDTCVSSTHLNSLFGANSMFLPLENHDEQAGFISKNTQFSQGNNMLNAPPSNIDALLYNSAE